MEKSDRVYKLYVDENVRVLGFLNILIVVLLVPGAFFVWQTLFGDIPYSPWIFGLAMLTFVGGHILRSLTLPYRISFSSDGRIEFTSTLRRKVVFANEVRSIKPEGLTHGTLIVRSIGKTIVLRPQFDGFHDFLARLKALNPNIELRGC